MTDQIPSIDEQLNSLHLLNTRQLMRGFKEVRVEVKTAAEVNLPEFVVDHFVHSCMALIKVNNGAYPGLIEEWIVAASGAWREVMCNLYAASPDSIKSSITSRIETLFSEVGEKELGPVQMAAVINPRSLLGFPYAHAGVTDTELFMKWLDMKSTEVERFLCSCMAREKESRTDMLEWAWTHAGVIRLVQAITTSGRYTWLPSS